MAMAKSIGSDIGVLFRTFPGRADCKPMTTRCQFGGRSREQYTAWVSQKLKRLRRRYFCVRLKTAASSERSPAVKVELREGVRWIVFDGEDSGRTG